MNNGYSMVQNQPNGGYSFSYNGTPISALAYSQGMGTPFYSLLSGMASHGDTGAGSLLQTVGAGPGGLSQDQSTINGIGYNYGDPGTAARALTWGGTPTQLGATAYGSGTSANPGLDAYMQASNMAIGNLQGAYNAVQPAEDAMLAGVQQQYQPQFNTLQSQHASGLANLDLSQKALDTQKSSSLRDLGNQLRQQYMSMQNQLGVMGAGNSSATDLLGRGLAQEANTGRYDIGNQYGLQESGINQQHSDLESAFQNQKDALDAWKQNSLNQIAIQYANQQQQIKQDMLQAGSDQVRTALYMQDQALANQALQGMQALDAKYGQALQGLNAQFSKVQAPVADISKYTGGYNVQPISAQQLQGLSYQANAAPNQSVSSAPLGIALQRNPQATPGTLASLQR